MTRLPSTDPRPCRASTVPHAAAPPSDRSATTAPSTKNGANTMNPYDENCTTIDHSHVRDEKARHPVRNWATKGSVAAVPDHPTRSAARHSALST